MNIFRLSFLLSFILVSSCGAPPVVKENDPSLARYGEFLLYRGEKFNGILETRLDAVQVLRRTPYRNGLAHGTEIETYQTGQEAASREYSNGKKEGLHLGYYEDGKRRFSYSYRNDEFDGDFWEWYPSGALYIYAKFEKGQAFGRKVWREDGQIYINAVYFNGQMYGLPGSKLCRQVRSDSGRTSSM